MSKAFRPYWVSAAAAVLLLGGCDFVRTVAGRPTSGEIALKRVAIREADSLRQVAAAAAVEDSIRRKRDADRVAALAYFENEGIIIKTPSESHIRIDSAADAGYYINLGAFRSPENAENLRLTLSSFGYPQALTLPFSNGLRAVVIPVEAGNEVALKDMIVSLRRESFCPPDIWVLSITGD